MDRLSKAAFRSAQRAQETMQDYIQDVAAGVAPPSRSKAEKLARACEVTFKEWMAACAGFTVH